MFFSISGNYSYIDHKDKLYENRLFEKMSIFVHCSIVFVLITKLQKLVQWANLNLPYYFYQKFLSDSSEFNLEITL